MYRKVLPWLCLFLTLAGTAAAKDRGRTAQNAAKAPHQKEETKPAEAKELSGMSIVGNDEAPKALYIVPWKSSEIGVETNMNMLLNAGDTPVDREVFMRQLDFYELSTKKQ
ncbi:MAG TPA: hypothetical protein VF903_12985 [Nitrospirota bacterium]